MSIVCTENASSRQVTDGQSAELVYTITGTADEAAAITALKAAAPATLGGLRRQPVAIEPVHVDTAKPDTCIWTGTAAYAPFDRKEPPQTGDSVYNFDTGGGSQHITQSLQTVSRYPGTAPDFKGAIGVTHDNVEGVDITVPVYTFSESHYVRSSSVRKCFL